MPGHFRYVLSFVLILFYVAPYGALSQVPAASGRLTVTGEVTRPLFFTIDDLRKMPRVTGKVSNAREHKDETYEGVELGEVLKQSGVPQGSMLHGAAIATYVLAEAADGYRVTYSLAELDSGFQDSNVIIADRVDADALEAAVGPLRLVAPHDERPARWIRMRLSIKVVTVAK